MVHYHDELLMDMGINPYRKKNRWLEWLSDYRPADYCDVLAGVANKSD
jgi:hypothetical protein